MISDAALARLERASRDPENGKDVQVHSEDVFAAVREIRTNRRKADRGDELRKALRVIGDALHDVPMVGDL